MMIETNVWESAKNEDVILACKVIALMCDQVVYPCLTAVSAGAVPIERMGAFSDLLEQVLNSPQAIVQRKNMLEQFSDDVKDAQEKYREREYNVINDRGKINGRKKKVDYSTLLMFTCNEERKKALLLTTAF